MLSNNSLSLTDKKDFVFGSVPEDYFQYKRIDVFACKDCCEDRRMTVYLAEEGNLNQLLRDKSKKPSFEWAETFVTLINNQVHIYTNDEFEISNAEFIYYRQPRKIQIQGCVDPYTNVESLTEVLSEFKDDIIEVIIDEAVSIIAGDIESPVQYPRGTQTAERNN